MPLISACACSTETPGFRRPITGSQNDPRASRSVGSGASGVHSSASEGTRSVPGITPMISCGRPFKTMVRPSTFDAPPNRRCQRP